MSDRDPQSRAAPKAAARHNETIERSQEELDELLDEALAETFPASDPIELAPSVD